MNDLGQYTDIMNRLLSIQDRFYPDVQEYFTIGEGKVSLLKVVGIDGESMLLKVKGNRIVYASENDVPIDVFRCTSDTFLNILAGDESLREAITKGHFLIESARTGNVDLVECQKWSKAFERLGNVVKKFVGI